MCVCVCVCVKTRMSAIGVDAHLPSKVTAAKQSIEGLCVCVFEDGGGNYEGLWSNTSNLEGQGLWRVYWASMQAQFRTSTCRQLMMGVCVCEVCKACCRVLDRVNARKV